MKKVIAIILISLLALAALSACGLGGDSDADVEDEGAESGAGAAQGGAAADGQTEPDLGGDVYVGVSDAERENMTLEEQMENKIKATITMENGGVIKLELYPDLAPQSVRNFVSLARAGFYDGLTFHRIISGFMIQGGCPDGTGMGNPGYSIKGEFKENGVENNLEHTRGVLSMARSRQYDSAGSQFFIMHGDSQHLDGAYAAFGKVASGMEVVDELAETPVLDNNGTVAPANMPVIKSITIDDDIQLPEPDKLGG